ncbi:MAG: PLP-dependent aminotransferase family protein [Limnochordia bacterium]|jgi:2-aminoadipate transaminase
MSEQPFATRMQGATSNVIREILKVTQRPEIISFAGGMPDPGSFPLEFIREACGELLTRRGEEILQYGTSEGYLPLREGIVDFVAQKGIAAQVEDVLILSGSQQGIDLTAKALLDPGDGVIVEEPTYLAALSIFRSYEAQIIPVAGDEEGMDPAALEEALRDNKIKLIYLVPTFQNPTGLTYGEARRRRIGELAAKYGVYVIEDDPYGDLRYSGEALSALKAYDQEDKIVYLGTFSKIISPGLRVGFCVITDPQLRQKVLIGKQGTDVHTSNLSQQIVWKFLADGHLPRHIEQICDRYRQKRDLMLQCLAEEFPSTAKWRQPHGGLFLWVELEEGISTAELLPRAVEEKVAYVPGAPFYPSGGGENTLRLNFSNATEEKISLGCQRLGRVFKTL